MKQEELSLEEQVARIRRKRQRHTDPRKVRAALNAAFLLLAAIGLGIYFSAESRHVTGLTVIGVGMILKVAEFIMRFL